MSLLQRVLGWLVPIPPLRNITAARVTIFDAPEHIKLRLPPRAELCMEDCRCDTCDAEIAEHTMVFGRAGDARMWCTGCGLPD